jgi:hypothetical protein
MLTLAALNLYGLALPVYLWCGSHGIGMEPFWCGNSVSDPLGFNLKVLLPVGLALWLCGIIESRWRNRPWLFWRVNGWAWFVAWGLNLALGIWFYEAVEMGFQFFREQIWWM